MQLRAWQRPLRFVDAQHGWSLLLRASTVASAASTCVAAAAAASAAAANQQLPGSTRRRPGSMGKGGTRFVGDAVAVRGKSKGYTSKDQKKVSRQQCVHFRCRLNASASCRMPALLLCTVVALPLWRPTAC